MVNDRIRTLRDRDTDTELFRILARNVRLVCGFSVEVGIKQINQKLPGVHIVTATIDSGLNEVGYIVPGLGDAGDRLFLP